MSNRRHGYAQVGQPEPGASTQVVRAGLGRAATIAITVSTLLSVLTACFVGVSFYYGYTSWKHDQTQDVLITNLQTQADNEAATRIQADAALQTEVDDRLASLNSVHGDNTTHNVDLVVNGTGFTITPDPDTHTVVLRNEAVQQLNDVKPTVADGTVYVVGEGMLEIDNDVNASTITINATAIVQQLSNLQAQVSMQQIQILELETNATMVETVVNALVNALQAISGGENSTQMLNETIAQLVLDVATATVNVAVIQSQIANLTMNEPMPGMLVPWSGADGGPIPSGWLLCDGAEYNITDYAALYAVIGTMYCNGPCSSLTVFAVPDMRGRMPVHKGGTVLNAAIGTQAGAETHTLTSAEMPSHVHTGTTNTDGNHVHAWPVKRSNDGDDPASPSVCVDFGSFREYNNLGLTKCGWDPLAGWDSYTSLRTDGLNSLGVEASGGLAPPNSPVHVHGFTTNNAGSGAAHNNIQPSLVMQYIIKT